MPTVTGKEGILWVEGISTKVRAMQSPLEQFIDAYNQWALPKAVVTYENESFGAFQRRVPKYLRDIMPSGCNGIGSIYVGGSRLMNLKSVTIESRWGAPSIIATKSCEEPCNGGKIWGEGLRKDKSAQILWWARGFKLFPVQVLLREVDWVHDWGRGVHSASIIAEIDGPFEWPKPLP